MFYECHLLPEGWAAETVLRGRQRNWLFGVRALGPPLGKAQKLDPSTWQPMLERFYSGEVQKNILRQAGHPQSTILDLLWVFATSCLCRVNRFPDASREEE